MFHCHVCGGQSAKTELVSEVFEIGGRRVLVERIPARMCNRCGESTFARETTEQIRKMVNGDARPDRTVPLDVFALA